MNKPSLVTDADYNELYYNLPADLASFQVAGPMYKSMRWFSWNTQSVMHAQEGPALRMLLDHFYGEVEIDAAEVDPADPSLVHNPAQQLKVLKARYSGFKLGQKLLSSRITEYRHKSWFVITQATWDWYKHRVDRCKSPADGLRDLAAHARSPACMASEVTSIVQSALHDGDKLRWIGFTRDAPRSSLHEQRALVAHHVDAALTLAMHRGQAKLEWGMPPFCYAGLCLVCVFYYQKLFYFIIITTSEHVALWQGVG